MKMSEKTLEKEETMDSFEETGETTHQKTNKVPREMNLIIQEDFTKALKRARKSEGHEKLTDVTLISKDGKKFPVHSVILSIRSKYFKELFSQDKQKTKYKMKIKAGTLEKILAYIYGDFKKCFDFTSNVCNWSDEERIKKTFKAAKELQLQSYEDEYCKYLVKEIKDMNGEYDDYFNYIVLAQNAILTDNKILIDELRSVIRKGDLREGDHYMLCYDAIENKCEWLLDEISKVLHDPNSCGFPKCQIWTFNKSVDYTMNMTEETLKSVEETLQFVAKLCLPAHADNIMELFVEFYYPQNGEGERKSREEIGFRKRSNEYVYPLEEFADKIPWTEFDEKLYSTEYGCGLDKEIFDCIFK